MKVKTKKSGILGSSSNFNTHALCEIIVYFEDGEATTDYPSDYLFFLESTGEWVEFRDERIISDNYNTRFWESTNPEEIERGYQL